MVFLNLFIIHLKGVENVLFIRLYIVDPIDETMC